MPVFALELVCWTFACICVLATVSVTAVVRLCGCVCVCENMRFTCVKIISCLRMRTSEGFFLSFFHIYACVRLHVCAQWDYTAIEELNSDFPIHSSPSLILHTRTFCVQESNRECGLAGL